MKTLNNYILENKIIETYGFLYEDPINEGIIRNGLKKAWEWIKSKFRRKKNPYMDDYFYKHAYQVYDYDTDPMVEYNDRKVNAINTQKTIRRLLNNDVLNTRLEKNGKRVQAAELYDNDDKMCGVLVYSPYDVSSTEKHFIILGLECTKFDDPDLINVLKKIAINKGCSSPMYVSKTEYAQNEYFYQKEKFTLLDDDHISNLRYAKKEF